MRQLKKRVVSALCMAACLFVLAACGTVQESSSMNEMEAASLQDNTKMILEQLMTMSDADLGMAIEQYRGNGMEALAAGLEGYVGVKKDLGAFQSVSGGMAKEIDGGYSVSLDVLFEKRECEFNITLDKQMTAITSMSFNPVYTTGENMVKAALNTLMGMGTVFAVLIFISWLIGCFRYISMFEDRMKKKEPQPAPLKMKAPAPAPVKQRELTDDLELVAVITAAIAASEGASADGLVVRSIRRAPGSKWKKA